MDIKRIAFNILMLTIIVSLCLQCGNQASKPSSQEDEPRGNLFIIGGGKRPVVMLEELLDLTQLKNKETAYGIILPMSSSEPDTSAYYAVRQFVELGVSEGKFTSFNIRGGKIRDTQLDSIRNAELIYMTGGDQSRFLQSIEGTEIQQAIADAYHRGATIAGTSAGAALMSELMITGDEFKHPEYTGYFRTIEADNIETVKGLGLLKNSIVDQHFIWRMRMNRLLSAVLENPGMKGIGIDEATAYVVTPDSNYISGIGQVIILENPQPDQRVKDGLLGAKNIKLSVLLPRDVDDSFGQ